MSRRPSPNDGALLPLYSLRTHHTEELSATQYPLLDGFLVSSMEPYLLQAHLSHADLKEPTSKEASS